MLIPQHLISISELSKQSNNSLILDIKCQCGNSKFKVFKNIPLESEKESNEKWITLINKRFRKGNIEQYSDQNGEVFIVRKNLFGKVIDKEKLHDMPRYSNVNIIKIICSECKKEHVLFDNRIHGYNSFVDGIKSCTYDNISFKQKTFKGSLNNLLEIKVRINIDSSVEEFKSEVNLDITLEEYSNAYSDITVFGNIVDVHYKKVVVYSEETA